MGQVTIEFFREPNYIRECGIVEDESIPGLTIWWNHSKKQWESNSNVEQYPQPVCDEGWNIAKLWELWRESCPKEQSLSSLINQLSRSVKVVGSDGLIKKDNHYEVHLTISPSFGFPTEPEMQDIADTLNAYAKDFDISIKWRR